MTQCIVKGCGTKAPLRAQLCERCYVMLSRGILIPSSAWFVSELEFVNEQNHYAMEQVRKLHDKVNELTEDQ